jgi:hypothetical protein
MDGNVVIVRRRRSFRRPLRAGAERARGVANLTNPKSLVYYTSIFAAMLPPATSLALREELKGRERRVEPVDLVRRVVVDETDADRIVGIRELLAQPE